MIRRAQNDKSVWSIICYSVIIFGRFLVWIYGTQGKNKMSDKEMSYEEKKRYYSKQLYEMVIEHNWHEVTGFIEFAMDEALEEGEKKLLEKITKEGEIQVVYDNGFQDGEKIGYEKGLTTICGGRCAVVDRRHEEIKQQTLASVLEIVGKMIEEIRNIPDEKGWTNSRANTLEELKTKIEALGGRK